MSNKVKKFTERNTIELYAEWYFNELKENGFIKSIHREPYSLKVTDKKKLNRYRYKESKNGIQENIEEYLFLRDANYTPDYLIVWEEKARDYFFNMIDQPKRLDCPFMAQTSSQGDIISLCDVKPTAVGATFGHNTSGYTFPIIQKVLFQFYGIYINKTVPIPLVSKGEIKSGNNVALFTTTFVPNRYLLTDSGQQARKINYFVRSLKEYLSRREKEIARITQAKQTRLL